jgi:tripartite ATP-independent transporter DctM subunit
MGFLVLAGFFVLFILGAPVVLAIALPAILYVLINQIPMEMISQRLHYALNSYPLVAVPVFIFIGNLMNSTGITQRIFKFADTLTGRVHGGLAQVNIFASLIFAGMSGAALADVGGLGQIEIKAMEDKGFKRPFAAAVTIASSTIGPIFPPSIPIIIYGAVAGVSVVKLLLGGIIPAFISVVFLMLITGFISNYRNLPRAERWSTLSEIVRDLLPALPALLAPAFLVFGMVSGYFTPTEAASITVIYILFISKFIYRELTWKHFIRSSIEAIKASCGILIIVSVASLFGWILAVEKIPRMFSEIVMVFGENPWTLLLMVNLFLLFVGMFLDSTTATLLIVPMLAPPVVAAGVDPVHLGIVVVFNLMIGLITPPMGLALFMASDVANVSIQSVLKELWPFLLALLIALVIVTFIPQLTLWIPGLF